ncbi:MAG: metallophosphoesterase family protein [Promethearchaeota archaeon]
MKIGILSDSHLRVNPKSPDEQKYQNILNVLKRVFEGVDHIIHAGDVVMERFITDLQGIAPTSVVRGNMDRVKSWPKVLNLEFQGIKVIVAHEPEAYAYLTETPRIFIHGHTHYPRIHENSDGCLVLNPGSITKPRNSPYLLHGFSNDSSPRPSVAFLIIEPNNISAIIKKL